MSERKLKPRGIIKWHPYAAIHDPLSFQTEIDAYNRLTAKPTVSENQIEESNAVLLHAYYNKVPVYISYFRANKIECIIGQIKQIDRFKKEITLEQERIKTDEIIYVEYE